MGQYIFGLLVSKVSLLGHNSVVSLISFIFLQIIEAHQKFLIGWVT